MACFEGFYTAVSKKVRWKKSTHNTAICKSLKPAVLLKQYTNTTYLALKITCLTYFQYTIILNWIPFKQSCTCSTVISKLPPPENGKTDIFRFYCCFLFLFHFPTLHAHNVRIPVFFLLCFSALTSPFHGEHVRKVRQCWFWQHTLQLNAMTPD